MSRAMTFQDGYDFFQKSAGAAVGASSGSDYVGSIEEEISKLTDDMSHFTGFHTDSAMLKGDIAEFWHAGTFNINAAVRGSAHRAMVDRSHDFASTDVSTNFGDKYGLKYYSSGQESAKAQATSIFQRFKEYQAGGGKDSLEKFLTDRQYDTDAVLSDPIYSGQLRLIPHDQMVEAAAWLERMIKTEAARRPEQVERYRETLQMLKDRISDNQGNESIPLSREEAERLATLAKQGKFDAQNLGLTTEELLSFESVMKDSLKAGMSAAVISLALKVAPEIINAIKYLIENGEVDEEQFKKIGFAALSGTQEGFIRGTVSSAITTCCKGGLLGEPLKEVSPGLIAIVTVLAMNTVKNAYSVARGKMSRTTLANQLVKDMIVSGASYAGGTIGQAAIPVPVLGYLVGSLVGSLVGTFVADVGHTAVLSFCTETGITMFGLVEQDYVLPDDIIKEIGVETFDYETFEVDSFEPESFSFDTFDTESFQPDNLEIKFLRRGVIGVSRIGFIL